MPLRVLFEDNHCLAVDKPAGNAHSKQFSPKLNKQSLAINGGSGPLN